MAEDNQLTKVEADGEVQQLGERAAAAVSFANTLEVKDAASVKQAVDARAHINDLIKQAEARRKFFVDPYNALVKRLNAFFGPITDKLEEAKRNIGNKMVAYDDKVQREAEAEKAKALKKLQDDQKKADAAVAAGKITQAQADEKNAKGLEKAVEKIQNVEVPQKTVRSESGNSVSFRTVLKVVIVDEAAVPRQYCTPDPKKFKDMALALHKNKQPQIAGIKVEETKEPTSRTGIGAF